MYKESVVMGFAQRHVHWLPDYDTALPMTFTVRKSANLQSDVGETDVLRKDIVKFLNVR